MHLPQTLYALFREGVYRQQCGGLFATLAGAEEAAERLLRTEPDDHHHYAIVPFTLDVITPRVANRRRVDWPLDEAAPLVELSLQNGEIVREWPASRAAKTVPGTDPR